MFNVKIFFLLLLFFSQSKQRSIKSSNTSDLTNKRRKIQNRNTCKCCTQHMFRIIYAVEEHTKPIRQHQHCLIAKILGSSPHSPYRDKHATGFNRSTRCPFLAIKYLKLKMMAKGYQIALHLSGIDNFLSPLSFTRNQFDPKPLFQHYLLIFSSSISYCLSQLNYGYCW